MSGRGSTRSGGRRGAGRRKQYELTATQRHTMGLARTRYVHGEMVEAKKLCVELLRENPVAIEPYELLFTIAKDHQQEYEQALTAAQIIADTRSSDAMWWNQAAEMAERVGKHKLAAEYFGRQVAFAGDGTPLRREGQYRRIVCLVHCGRFAPARNAFAGYELHLQRMLPVDVLAAYVTAVLHSPFRPGESAAEADSASAASAAGRPRPPADDGEVIRLMLAFLDAFLAATQQHIANMEVERDMMEMQPERTVDEMLHTLNQDLASAGKLFPALVDLVERAGDAGAMTEVIGKMGTLDQTLGRSITVDGRTRELPLPPAAIAAAFGAALLWRARNVPQSERRDGTSPESDKQMCTALYDDVRALFFSADGHVFESAGPVEEWIDVFVTCGRALLAAGMIEKATHMLKNVPELVHKRAMDAVSTGAPGQRCRIADEKWIYFLRADCAENALRLCTSAQRATAAGDAVRWLLRYERLRWNEGKADAASALRSLKRDSTGPPLTMTEVLRRLRDVCRAAHRMDDYAEAVDRWETRKSETAFTRPRRRGSGSEGEDEEGEGDGHDDERGEEEDDDDDEEELGPSRPVIKREETATSARPAVARGKPSARGKGGRRKGKRPRGPTPLAKQRGWVAGMVGALSLLAETESPSFGPPAAVVMCAALHCRIAAHKGSARPQTAASAGAGMAGGGEEEEEEDGVSSEHSLLPLFAELVPRELQPYLPPACRPSEPNRAAALPLPVGGRSGMDGMLRCFCEQGDTEVPTPEAVASVLGETDVWGASAPHEFGVVVRRFVWLLLKEGRPLLARHLLRLAHRRPWRVPRRSRLLHTFFSVWAALRGRRGTDGVEEALRGAARLLRRSPNSVAFATLLWDSLSRLESQAAGDHKPVFRLLAAYPRAVPVLLLAALLRMRAKREEEAVATLHAALRAGSQSPLIHLLLATCTLATTRRAYHAARSGAAVRAMAYFQEYAGLRLLPRFAKVEGDPLPHEAARRLLLLMETRYNAARLLHQAGAAHSAQPIYEEVLRMHDVLTQRLEGEGEGSQTRRMVQTASLAPEAAHNLVVLLTRAGNDRAARAVMERYLAW